MEPTNDSNAQDANNRPLAHHGTGNGGRALVDEGIVGETTGTIGTMKTTRGVNSVVESRR